MLTIDRHGLREVGGGREGVTDLKTTHFNRDEGEGMGVEMIQGGHREVINRPQVLVMY